MAGAGTIRFVVGAAATANGVVTTTAEAPAALDACDSLRSSLRSLCSRRCGARVVSGGSFPSRASRSTASASPGSTLELGFVLARSSVAAAPDAVAGGLRVDALGVEQEVQPTLELVLVDVAGGVALAEAVDRVARGP